jgi:ankyrin repeat protein
VDSSPFNYAISHWLKHAMDVPHGACRTALSDPLWQLVEDFFWDNNGTTFAEWLRVIVSSEDNWHQKSISSELFSNRAFSSYLQELTVTSALHVAASYGLVDVLKRPVPYSLDFNVSDTAGTTPLMYAASIGDENATRAILSKPGLDVNRTRCRSAGVMGDCEGHCRTLGGTALESAADCHRVEVMKVLLRHPDIELDLVSHGDTALGTAITEGFSEGVELLIGAGARLAMKRGKVMKIPSGS